MVPTSPGKSWKVLEFEKSPGKSWNFAEILEKSWNFFCGQTAQKRDLGFLCMLNLAVHRLTNFHLRYIGCNNVYIYSAHHWVMIFKFLIKSLILELQNCMSNPSATISVLFDSSPFGTC